MSKSLERRVEQLEQEQGEGVPDVRVVWSEEECELAPGEVVKVIHWLPDDSIEVEERRGGE